jgi:hypothetical protein
MKKLIAAAVATSVSAIALADVSITGNANYEYFAKEDTSGFKSNYGDTEINLSVKGKSGDTTVVADFEVTNHGSTSSTTANSLDIENTYMTTKIGDTNVKAGNYSSGTTALGGEIDQGGRATDKVDLNTKVGNATIGYAVSSDSNAVYNTDGAAVYASMPIAGINFAVKEQSDSYTLMGASGEMGGVKFRVEQKDNDSAATGDVLFYAVDAKFGDINLQYAAIDADVAGTGATSDPVTEGDSAIFAQEMATDSTSSGKADVDGVWQIAASTVVDGTTITAKVGELTGAAGNQDAGFSRIEAKRALAGGTTLTVSYDDYETTSVATGDTMTDTQLLEIDLSVKF